MLKVFQTSKSAISHSDIEQKLKDNYDRVTLYRTLGTFLEKGIIHKVIDDSSVAKYAMCTDHHLREVNHIHSDDHVHFKCTKCEETVCLESISVPQIEMPNGFVKQEVSYLIKGLCENCSSN